MSKDIAKKIEDFFTQHKHLLLKKGEMLVYADEDPSGVFFIKKGNVRQYVISKNGQEVVVNIFKTGAFFPMSWAMNKTKNVYFFEASTDIEVWRAPRIDTISFIKQNPEVLYDLTSRVFKGTDGLLVRVTHLMSGSAYTRLIVELLIEARRLGNEVVEVGLEISEKGLATQTGMTRETVSREMQKLKKKDLVAVKGKYIIVPSVEKLELELTNNT